VTGFYHEAVFYSGDDEYLAGMLAEIGYAIDAGGSVLVAVGGQKSGLLREALDDRADAVEFLDMEQLGRNPACIIPVWREFLGDAGPGPVLGVGEPAWPGRTAAELVECRRHESLLNLAFDDGREWQLLCPFDVDGLEPAVIEDARHTHPHVVDHGLRAYSERYDEPQSVLAWDDSLPPPAHRPAELAFTGRDLALIRTFVADRAHTMGIEDERLSDLVLAVNELATNTMRHGGGRGVLRTWQENGTFLCEVRDTGRIDDPLAGRDRPSPLGSGGRGLWLVNQLCDLVQVRTSHAGNVVRLHMTLGSA
jgi:anti-sigma regulatory factor (Ser/Thr protein kinase)